METLNQKKFHYCQNHSDYIAHFLKVDIEEKDSFFRCGQCILDDNQNKNYLFVDSIVNSKDDQILKTLPLFCNQELASKLISIMSDYKDPIQIIEDEFNQFRDFIVSKIEEKKKAALLSVQNLQIDKQEIQNIYNKLSCRSQFKQILSKRENTEKWNKELKEFLDNQFQGKKQTEAELKQLLKKVQSYQDSYLLLNFSLIQTTCLQSLKKLDKKIEECKYLSEQINNIQNSDENLSQNQQNIQQIDQSAESSVQSSAEKLNTTKLLKNQEVDERIDLCTDGEEELKEDYSDSQSNNYNCEDDDDNY